MQDLNDIAYFAEVVDKGGFAAAGRSLAIPKSRLSRRVAELESRLGARLLQRTTRKLSLTTVGEQVYRHAVAMREQAAAAEEVVAHVADRAARHDPRGLSDHAGADHDRPGRFGLPGPHPQVSIDMRVSNRVVDLVEEGFDVALRVRLTLDDSGSMVVKNLGPTHALLVASPALIARQGQPHSPQDLARLDTVSMAATDGLASWHLRGPGGEHFTLQPPAAPDRRRPADAAAGRARRHRCGRDAGLHVPRRPCSAASWCWHCPAGHRRRASCTRCFRRAAAWCRRCGSFWISWASTCTTSTGADAPATDTAAR